MRTRVRYGVLKGQCLCGAVTYQYNAAIQQSILCFCTDCKKAQGAVFGWNSPIQQSEFQLLSGQSVLKEYFHTENKGRVFCMQCGSPIYSYRTDLPNILRLRLGTVTSGRIPAPSELAYRESQPDFMCIDTEML